MYVNRNHWKLLAIIACIVGLPTLYERQIRPVDEFKKAEQKDTYMAYLEYQQNYPHFAERYAVEQRLAAKWADIYENLSASDDIQNSSVLKEVVDILNTRQEKVITISASPSFPIKDYKSFPTTQRETLDILFELDTTVNYPLPSASPPPSMHSFLMNQGKGLFEKDVATALHNKLERIGRDAFLKVSILDSPTLNHGDIHIAYQVDNEYLSELGLLGLDRIPNLLVYIRENPGIFAKRKDGFLGYVLAFKVKGTFEVGGKTVPFQYNPTGSVRDIQSLEEGYLNLFHSLLDTVMVYL